MQYATGSEQGQERLDLAIPTHAPTREKVRQIDLNKEKIKDG